MTAICIYILTLLTCSISLAITKPGDTIIVHEGNYAGGLHFASLQGTTAKQIYIIAAPASTVVLEGGVNAWHLTDAAFTGTRKRSR